MMGVLGGIVMNKMKYILYSLSVCVAAYLFPNIAVAEEENYGISEENTSSGQGKAAAQGDTASSTEEGFTLGEAPEKKPTPVYFSDWQVGLIYSSADSFKAGEYTGIEEEGFYPAGSFLVRNISAYDDKSTKYSEASGTILGMNSRSLYGKYGEQGKYGVYADYDELPHFQIGDARSLFVGAGTTFQTTPAGWTTGDLTSDLTANNPGVFPSNNQVDIKTDRTTLGGGLSWIPAEHWLVKGNYHHQIKDGTEHLAAYFGEDPDEARSSTLIIPVDYNFDDFDMGISFANEKYQLDLRYYLSLFNNDNKSVIWQNPFSSPATADHVFGQTSLPPDNRAHQFVLTGGYNFGETSRVSADVSYAKMLQNDAFLPYTINPNLTANIPLPRANLDGEVDKIHATFNFSTRPWRKLDLGARYNYDDWDNNTPRTQYFIVMQDAVDQNPDPAELDNRINRNYSFRQQKAELNAGYRLTNQTKLSLGYDYDWHERNYSEVAITREHTGKVKLSSSLTSMASGWIEYAYSDRNGSNYVVNRPLLSNASPEFIAATAGCTTFPFTDCRSNDPWQRKFYLANRVKQQMTGSLTIMPADLISLGLIGRYANENYDETIVGLTDLERYDVTIDVGYTPTTNIDTYAYYTQEFIARHQSGLTTDQESITPTPVQWKLSNEDSSFTLGAGIKWSKIRGKYDLTADYIFSKALTNIDPTNFVGTPPPPAVPFPDLVTDIQSFRLTGDYHLKDNVIMRLTYMFEHFSTKNWALDGVGQNTIGQVITLGNQSPDYNDHIFGLSVIYKF